MAPRRQQNLSNFTHAMVNKGVGPRTRSFVLRVDDFVTMFQRHGRRLPRNHDAPRRQRRMLPDTTELYDDSRGPQEAAGLHDALDTREEASWHT